MINKDIENNNYDDMKGKYITQLANNEKKAVVCKNTINDNLSIYGDYEDVILLKNNITSLVDDGFNFIIMGDGGTGKSRLLKDLFQPEDIIDILSLTKEYGSRINEKLIEIIKATNSDKLLIIDDFDYFVDKDKDLSKSLEDILPSFSQCILTIFNRDILNNIKPHIKGKLCYIFLD